MAHDHKTRTIDYTEEHPPEWATPEEKMNFHPKRLAKFICIEIRKAEEKLEAQKNEETKARAMR